MLLNSSLQQKEWSLSLRCGFFFPHATAACATPISLLSPTHTPLRCPAFSSSPPLCWHVSESTEGPNTQTRQGLTSTFTARLQMEMEDRRAGHRGGWGGGPRRRQSSYILEAKRKCRQRARSLRTSIRDLPLAMLRKVFWLRDDSQVYALLRLQYGSRLWRLARTRRRPTKTLCPPLHV